MADVKTEQDVQKAIIGFLGYFEYEGLKFPKVVLKESLEELETFEVRPDDIWVCSYPKSGTHFAMEISALIIGDGDPLKSNRHGFFGTVGMFLVENPLPPPPSPDENDGQSQRPFFEDQLSQKLHHQTPVIDVIKKAPSPRIIVTHLPFQCLPPNIEKRAKILYVARNPKDIAASTMTFVEKTFPVPGEFPTVLDDVMNGENFGGWYNHVMGYWKKRNEKNVLFLKYEDMVKDLRGCVKEVVDLLEHPLSDEAFEKVVAGSEFKGMKKTYDTIEKSFEKGVLLTKAFGQMSFMQTGKIGTWKTRFTVGQNEMFDAWYKEKFAGLDLQFQFELSGLTTSYTSIEPDNAFREHAL